MDIAKIFSDLGLSESDLKGGSLDVATPVDGSVFASVKTDSAAEADAKIAASVDAFKAWRTVPGPRRGELVRLLGEDSGLTKKALGRL